MFKPLNSDSDIKFKKTNNLPKDDQSVGLAWFSSKAISPANNLSITDLSGFTPENSYATEINSSSFNLKNKLVFANELGVLEDDNANTIFDCDDVSVSDLFLDEETLDKRYIHQEIKNKMFVHSYYVSRYYTMLPVDSFLIDDLNSFIEENKIPKSIKVIDENGQEYVDKNSGSKKYRILLDQIDNSIYEERSNRPYKVVVLFSDPHPKNLQLVYDKVNLSSTDSVSSVVPQYKENINTVNSFNQISEESIAVDNSMRSKKIFSKKSITFKNNIINNNSSTDGFEIVVPKKAISDSRTYETFNWRLVAKILRQVDVSSVNGQEELDSESNIKQKVVNCAVLCTSSQLSEMTTSGNYGSANPYVFYRLQQSPYNLSKYSYVNPNSTVTKNLAVHWLMSIDTITNEQLSSFDILAWSPISPITQEQGQKIKYFVENTQGTIVLDLSSSSGAESIDSSLTVSSDSYDLDTWSYNTNNVFLDEKKNNAWPINPSVFETVTIDSTNYDIYSIFGRSNVGSLALGITTSKKAKEFTGSYSESNVVLKNSRGKPIFVGQGYTNTADALLRGNILATTCSLLKYCNDIYQASSIFDFANQNAAPASIDQTPFSPVASTERTV